MYILKKVLPTLDNIITYLKQSIGYTRIEDRLRKDPSYEVCLHTLWVNGKVLMERQDVVLSRIRYLRMVRELREAGYTVVYTDETYGYTSHAVPKCWQDSTTGFKNSGIALPLGLHYNHYLSSSARPSVSSS